MHLYFETMGNDEVSADLLKGKEEMYACYDYLDARYQHNRLDGKEAEDFVFSLFPGRSSSVFLDETWRRKMAEWCYEVVDHYEFSREAVDICISILDRYLCMRKVTKTILQLATMTSLNIALKVHEPRSLKLSTLIRLGRGRVTKEQIIAMEHSIVEVLGWRVNPPTIMSAIRIYLAMVDKEFDSKTKTWVEELARYLSEVSVCDYFFVTMKPTSVALACILSSFTIIAREQTLRTNYLYQKINTEINCSIEEVHDCRIRLLDIYEDCNYDVGERTPSPDTFYVPAVSGNSDYDLITSHSEFEDSTHVNESNENSVSANGMRPLQIFSSVVSLESASDDE